MSIPAVASETFRAVQTLAIWSRRWVYPRHVSKYLLTLCILVTALVGFFGGWSRSSTCPKYQQTIRVRLKWKHQAQFAGFYVAETKGFFADEGLNVELEEGPMAAPSIQMVASGKDQFGVAAAEDIVVARSDKIPIKAVFVVFQESPFCFMVRKDTGIERLDQLKGQTVGVQPGNHEVVTYRAMLLATNPPMTENDIRQVVVGDDREDMMSKFVNQRTVTAWPSYSINEPILLELKGIQTTVIRASDYVKIYGDTLFTTERMINDYPCVVGKLVAAVKKGWEYARDHPDEAVEATIIRRNGSTKDGSSAVNDRELDHKLQERMLAEESQYLVGDSKTFGTMSDDRWFRIYDVLLKDNLIGPDPDFRKAYTSSFLSR